MNRIVIIGGGLAGLAAASALAPRGFAVTLLESRQRLGGRASSFTDPATQQLVDACQHVSMGCCTNWKHFCQTVGIAHYLEAQPVLYFVTPDRRVSRFKADPWPAPWHLGRALLGAHYLTPLEKLRIISGLVQLWRMPPEADPPLLPWLRQHGQTETTLNRYWAIVLVSALNESLDRVGLKYARKVFVEGFMSHREGFVVEVPKVPLGRLYGDELRQHFLRQRVVIRENAGVQELLQCQGRIQAAVLRDGSTITADEFILAVPFERVDALLPEPLRLHLPLESSPITSVHLWFDRPTLQLPHAVLIDSLGQWVFNRGEVAPGEFYVQVVVSAARCFRGLGKEEVQARILQELRQIFPAVAQAQLRRAKVVTEHAATFSAVPGIDQYRPPQQTACDNLFLAGDWTQTGWPATMEGAVRSGYLAAEAVLRRYGRPESLVQPPLPSSGLFRNLLQ